jgi:hypothetical protein
MFLKDIVISGLSYTLSPPGHIGRIGRIGLNDHDERLMRYNNMLFNGCKSNGSPGI